MNVHDLKRILVESMKTDLGLNVPKSERTRENKRKFRKEWRKAFKGGYAYVGDRSRDEGKPPKEMTEKGKRRALEHRLDAIAAGHLASRYTNMKGTGLHLAVGDERRLKTLAFRNIKTLGRKNPHTHLQYRKSLVWWTPEALTPEAIAERRKTAQASRKMKASRLKRKLAYAKWLAENRKSKPVRQRKADQRRAAKKRP
jgi:hypothetical protein